MKSTEWKRFAGPLLGPGWSFSKFLAYRIPVGWVLRGLYAESTRSGGFYLWDVAVPLYWPSDVLALSWSERVGGGSHRWDSDDVTAAAIGSAARTISGEERSSVLLDSLDGADNVLKREARAYGLIVESRADEAINALSEVKRYAAEYPWEHNMVSRALAVSNQLVAGDLVGAQAVIARWRAGTAKALGIVLDDDH